MLNILLTGLIAGLLSSIVTIITQYFVRKSNKETDIWRIREETYRMLRFAIELTNQHDNEIEIKGIIILEELLDSELLQKEDREMIYRIFIELT